MIALALLLAAAQPAPRAPLSAYASQGDQILACVAYLETGDESRIEVDIGEGEIGTLECEDYPDAMPIVARRAKERAFREWYAAASKRLGLNTNPDDPRHCYDYRAFFDAFRAGKVAEPVSRGDRFPGAFEKACHPRS